MLIGDRVSQCLGAKPFNCVVCLLSIQCGVFKHKFLFFKYSDTLQVDVQRANRCFSYNGFGRPNLATFIHKSLLHFGHQIFPYKEKQTSPLFLKHSFSSKVEPKA